MQCLTLGVASVLITVVAAANCRKAEEPYQTVWSAQPGSNPQSVAVDSSGAAYVAGYDLTNSNSAEPRQFHTNAWLAKLDPEGRQIWKKSILAEGAKSYSRSVAVDASGSAFVAGETDGDLAGTNQGETDAWLAKFAANGDRLWITQLGASGYDSIRSVAVDYAGAVYVAGRTTGNLAGKRIGYQDVWVARFDSGGAELWKTQLGSSRADKLPVVADCESIAVDSAGAVYLTGQSIGDFAGKSQGKKDAWLAKLDPAGKLLWKKQFGTSSTENGTSVAVDASGGIYVTGYSNGPLAGPFQGGKWDAWLAKFDSSGEQLWKTQLGTKREERSFAVAVDSTGGVYVAGATSGDLAGASKGGWDAWIAKFDSNGAELWRTQLGSDAMDKGRSIAIGRNHSVYLTGTTSGNLGGESQDSGNGFLIRLSPRN